MNAPREFRHGSGTSCHNFSGMTHCLRDLFEWVHKNTVCCNSHKDAAGYFDTTMDAEAHAIDAIKREKMTFKPIGQYLANL